MLSPLETVAAVVTAFGRNYPYLIARERVNQWQWCLLWFRHRSGVEFLQMVQFSNCSGFSFPPIVAASRAVPCAAMCLRRSGFGLPGRWRSLCNPPACGSVECCPRNLHLPDRDSSLQHTLKLRLQLASESFPRVQWLSWLGSALVKKIS